jgi:ABC-type sugar transport system ATPase subunit
MNPQPFVAMPAAAPAPEVPALEVRGLTKRFPGVLALDDVSFALKRGEVHAVVGQNGAGKSTMINLVAGMLPPDAGTILLDGGAVEIGSTRRAIELGIATVYQELSLLPNLTVAQNIALGREPRRHGLLDLSAMRAMSDAALARLGLAIPANTRVGALSLAERQLVEIAKALAGSPSVLILDEPTAALGGREADRLFEILRGLRAQGIAILYVSHRFGEILKLCDRATILRNGRLVTTTSLDGWSEAQLTEAMVGRGSEHYIASRRGPSGAFLLEAREMKWRARVRDVSLGVRQGEILVLTGLLGAGQNEIGRILGGDLQAESGRITLGGRKLALSDPRSAIAAGICLLTDDRKQEGILPNLSLAANVALPSLSSRRAGAFFVDAGGERQAVETSRNRFGVVARSLGAPIRTLSGGNQQRALLARWHLADAEVFVLIEPTRGVDVAARADIYRRLDALAAAGKALVVITSDVPEALALADRILVIDDGAVVAETRPADTDEERLNLLVQGTS